MQDLIDQKVISIDTQEAASSSTPPPASSHALGVAPSHSNIVHQPLPEHSGSGGVGTSGVHSIFPSGSAMSVVDLLDLIHHVSEPLSSSLYRAALASPGSGIHLTLLEAKRERATADPADCASNVGADPAPPS